MKEQRRLLCTLCVVLLIFVSLSAGCSVVKEDKEKTGDIEYTVVKEEELPKEAAKAD